LKLIGAMTLDATLAAEEKILRHTKWMKGPSKKHHHPR
jgi:hypothetical protein